MDDFTVARNRLREAIPVGGAGTLPRPWINGHFARPLGLPYCALGDVRKETRRTRSNPNLEAHLLQSQLGKVLKP